MKLNEFLICFAIALLLVWLAGCAASAPSSTDNHHRVPGINCTQKLYDGQYHKFCCEGEHCVLVE